MAIANYGDLKTRIGDFMFDAGIVDTEAADIVTLSQAMLNVKLRCREMVTSTDLSPTSGVFTLPSDYAQWRMVVEKASQRRPLEFISMEEAEEIYPDRPSGLGVHFTITGSSLRVFPTIANDINFVYYARLGAFADDDATDWLLTRYPHVYLCAGQMIAAEFIKDDAEYAKHAAALERYVDMIHAQDDLAEMASAGIHIQGVTP